MKETLNKIREEPSASVTIQQKISQVLLSLALGMLLGFIAKYSDTIPSNGFTGNIWGFIRDITTRLGIWVLLAAMMAVWSHNPRMGAMKVFAWIAALCAAMPIGLLVSEGYPFFYTFAIPFGFDILSAIILFLLLPINHKQRLRIFTSAFLIVFILRNSNALSYLFGGL